MPKVDSCCWNGPGYNAGCNGQVSTAKEGGDTGIFPLGVASPGFVVAAKEDVQPEGFVKPCTLQGAGTVHTNAVGVSAFALAQGNTVESGVASHGSAFQATVERMARNDRFSSPFKLEVSPRPCRYPGDNKLQPWPSLPMEDRPVSSKLHLDRHPSARLDRQASGSINVLDRQGSTMLGLERQHSSKLAGLARQPSNSPLSLERQPSESILAAVGQQLSSPDSPPSLDNHLGVSLRRSPGTGASFRNVGATQSPASRRPIPFGSRGAEVTGRGGGSLLKAGEGLSPGRTSSQRPLLSAVGAPLPGRMHSPAPSTSIAGIAQTSSLKKTSSLTDLVKQVTPLAPMGRQPSSPFPLALQKEAGLPVKTDCVDEKANPGDNNLSPPATPPESAPVVGNKGVISSSSSNSSQEMLCPLPSTDSCITPEVKPAGVFSADDMSRRGQLPNVSPPSPFAAQVMSALSLKDADAGTDGSFRISPPLLRGQDDVRQGSTTPPPIPCHTGSPAGALSGSSTMPGPKVQDLLDEAATQVYCDSPVGDGAIDAELQRANLSSSAPLHNLMKDLDQPGLMADGARHSQPALEGKDSRDAYDRVCPALTCNVCVPGFLLALCFNFPLSSPYFSASQELLSCGQSVLLTCCVAHRLTFGA